MTSLAFLIETTISLVSNKGRCHSTSGQLSYSESYERHDWQDDSPWFPHNVHVLMLIIVYNFRAKSGIFDLIKENPGWKISWICFPKSYSKWARLGERTVAQYSYLQLVRCQYGGQSVSNWCFTWSPDWQPIIIPDMALSQRENRWQRIPHYIRPSREMR